MEFSSFVESENLPSQSNLALLFRVSNPFPQSLFSSSSSSHSPRINLQLPPHRYFNEAEFNHCSNLVNGLICWYRSEDAQIYLHNVTTGEVKLLPTSQINKPANMPSKYAPIMSLGFDPLNQEYKLILGYFDRDGIKYFILTLGKSSSSREITNIINDMPNTAVFGFCSTICMNGVIYWSDAWCTTVTYFNVGGEKFGSLSPPEPTCFMLDFIQTAIRRKLTFHIFSHKSDQHLRLLYDDVNKVWMKKELKSPLSLNKVKAGSGEVEGIDMSMKGHILATLNLASAPPSLDVPSSFRLTTVCRYADNLIPLDNLV